MYSHAEYYAANRERVLARQAAYYLANKEKIAARVAKWQAANKDKKAAAQAAWRKANPAAVRTYNHNRRARVSGDRLSPDIVHRLLEAQNWACPRCRGDLRTLPQELDHITALSRGGRNVDENVQMLCRPCNRRKFTGV